VAAGAMMSIAFVGYFGVALAAAALGAGDAGAFVPPHAEASTAVVAQNARMRGNLLIRFVLLPAPWCTKAGDGVSLRALTAATDDRPRRS